MKTDPRYNHDDAVDRRVWNYYKKLARQQIRQQKNAVAEVSDQIKRDLEKQHFESRNRKGSR